MLSAWPDWRWGLGRVQDIWYPNTRLVRQAELNDWQSVLTYISFLITQDMKSAPSHRLGKGPVFGRHSSRRRRVAAPFENLNLLSARKKDPKSGPFSVSLCLATDRDGLA